MAAAVLLSLSSAADVTVAAVMLNAGRAMDVRKLADGESLGQWLSRLTDAARQVRSRVNGRTSDVKCIVATLFASSFAISLNADVTASATDTLAGPPAAPVRDFLTDLPPPRA